MPPYPSVDFSCSIIFSVYARTQLQFPLAAVRAFFNRLSHHRKIIQKLKTSFLFPYNATFIFLSLFFTWAALSLFWSPAPGASLLKLSTFLGGILCFVLGLWWSDRQFKYFQGLLILLTLYLVGLTAYQAFVSGIKRPSGHLLNWNSHGAFISMLLLPIAGSFIAAKSKNYY